VADFRSERMASPEGEGRAKDALERAWQAYYRTNRAINKPVLDAFPQARSFLRGYVSSKVFDLFGFWLMWRLTGGFDGMQQALGLSRSGLYRRIAMFREVFGEHPDVYEFPGVTVDPVEFIKGMAERQQKK